MFVIISFKEFTQPNQTLHPFFYMACAPRLAVVSSSLEVPSRRILLFVRLERQSGGTYRWKTYTPCLREHVSSDSLFKQMCNVRHATSQSEIIPPQGQEVDVTDFMLAIYA